MLKARMHHQTHIERLAGREAAARGRVAPIIGDDDTVPAVAPARVVGGGGSAPWAVGDVVAGRFVLQQPLGRGRYGPIYDALDRSLSEALIGVEHHVALQELHPRIATQPILLERLENLLLHPQSWSHPNLVKLLEFGRDGAKYFLTEELLEGASFRLVLDESREPLTYDEVLAVLRGVGDALNYAHAKGIVHGDLRPQSVFVTERYNVKLLDLLPGNEPRPTPFFPEDAGGDRQPHASDDVYGLACLAYELLTRRHPYNGNTALEALSAGLAPQPVPNLPPPRWQALSRGLALRRERRTAGVPELLAGLGVTGIETLRLGKNARAKPAVAEARAAQPAAAAEPVAIKREAVEAEAWPEVTVPSMDAQHRGAAGVAAPPVAVTARVRRLEEPMFANLAYDAETPPLTRSRRKRRSRPIRTAVGTALVAALAFVAYRDHSQLVIQTTDVIETRRRSRPRKSRGGKRGRRRRRVGRRAPIPRRAGHRTVHRCRVRRRLSRRLPCPRFPFRRSRQWSMALWRKRSRRSPSPGARTRRLLLERRRFRHRHRPPSSHQRRRRSSSLPSGP